MFIELDDEFENRKKIVEDIVNKIVSKENINISQTSFDNLVIHLSLMITRELNGTYIETSEVHNHLKDNDCYNVAEKIVKALNEEFDIHIDENQMSYVTMYLSNMNLLDVDFDIQFDLYDDDDDIVGIMDETMKEIKDDLHIDLTQNKDFYNGMSLHFYPAINRLKADQQLTNNPLKDEIQNMHQKEFTCAKIFNKVVNEHYHKSFNDHELAYIALHFGTAFRDN